jgi:polyadenylate-binding protein
VSVAAFKSKKERGGVNKTRFTNLYVKRLPADYSEGQLRELFAKYGSISSIMLAAESKAARPKRAAPGETKAAETAVPEKFGFVCFAAPEEANLALDKLNNYEIAPGKHLFVGRAQKREEREKELRERFEALKMERQKKYAGNITFPHTFYISY